MRNRKNSLPQFTKLIVCKDAVSESVSVMIQATSDKLRSSYAGYEQVAKKIANIRFDDENLPD